MSMRRLWLLRHAPVIAEAGLCYGASDLEAEAEATHAAAERIARELPPGLAVLSSPLRRCAALAGAIAALRPDLTVQHDVRIAEMDFGAWEGQSWSAIARAELDAWTADFADTRAGAHGESVRSFMARVAGAYDEWQAGQGDALWVAHAGVLRAVSLLHAGTRCPRDATEWPSTPLPFGGWQVVELRST